MLHIASISSLSSVNFFTYLSVAFDSCCFFQTVFVFRLLSLVTRKEKARTNLCVELYAAGWLVGLNSPWDQGKFRFHAPVGFSYCNMKKRKNEQHTVAV